MRLAHARARNRARERSTASPLGRRTKAVARLRRFCLPSGLRPRHKVSPNSRLSRPTKALPHSIEIYFEEAARSLAQPGGRGHSAGSRCPRERRDRAGCPRAKPVDNSGGQRRPPGAAWPTTAAQPQPKRVIREHDPASKRRNPAPKRVSGRFSASNAVPNLALLSVKNGTAQCQ